MERVTTFLISFWGGFKIYNTCCGGGGEWTTNFLTQYFKDFSAKYSVN